MNKLWLITYDKNYWDEFEGTWMYSELIVNAKDFNEVVKKFNKYRPTHSIMKVACIKDIDTI